MIIIKIVILYFIQITHTDDFPSTGTRLVRPLMRARLAAGIFIDLKNAFETVDQNILVNKLEHYGIRGVAEDWVCSYFENRIQYVRINDSNSECLDVKFGVPHDSALGPALFVY